jgi:hypothetical protein
MNSPEESRLREYFGNLRDADQPSAPPFSGTIASAERRKPAAIQIVRNPWAIAAVALALCGGTLAILRLRTTPAAPLTEPLAIATWSSPTAFLLDTPGRKFLGETPSIGVPKFLLTPAEKEQSK